ncbi:MAG: hypothetical protein JXA28_03210 [Bacteroidetes bacterium]|nr:hypothetical protein [Bacteroidota bacterium]
MKQQRTSHLPELRLIQLARSGEDHPHLAECAFCREQYEALREMLLGAPAERGESIPHDDRSFRLAAASEPMTTEVQRWRQTWYLEDGALVLRVLEDRDVQQLIGFCIGDPHRYAHLKIHFSGIARSFTPDAQGRFEIGPSSLEIEPMRVHIEEA